jgi:hypothetical protein
MVSGLDFRRTLVVSVIKLSFVASVAKLSERIAVDAAWGTRSFFFWRDKIKCHSKEDEGFD